jgi:hypothetical protein
LRLKLNRMESLVLDVDRFDISCRLLKALIL